MSKDFFFLFLSLHVPRDAAVSFLEKASMVHIIEVDCRSRGMDAFNPKVDCKIATRVPWRFNESLRVCFEQNESPPRTTRMVSFTNNVFSCTVAVCLLMHVETHSLT